MSAYPHPLNLWGPSFYTTAEAAKILELAPSTLSRLGRDWETSGGRVGLPRPKHGSRIFMKGAVLRYAQERAAKDLVERIYSAISRFASGLGKPLTPVSRFSFSCPKVEADHDRNSRFYAHAGHDAWTGPNGVCMIPDIARLPLAQVAGIVLHEVGHIQAGMAHPGNDEPAADDWVRDNLGIEILYEPEVTLERLSPKDMRRLGLI